MIGWHFLPENRRLRWGSQRVVKVGERRSCQGELVLCENGLHASERVLDALTYAPGPIACKVELSGRILKSDDKACARYRTVTAMADATTELHLFACWCATNALELAGVTDERSWEAIKAKRAWLKGQITHSDLAAAWAAARAAARDAARDAGAAAWTAVATADRGAAWTAARGAAWTAARDAGAVAWDAAQAAQNTELTKLLSALLKEAK